MQNFGNTIRVLKKGCEGDMGNTIRETNSVSGMAMLNWKGGGGLGKLSRVQGVEIWVTPIDLWPIDRPCIATRRQTLGDSKSSKLACCFYQPSKASLFLKPMGKRPRLVNRTRKPTLIGGEDNC